MTNNTVNRPDDKPDDNDGDGDWADGETPAADEGPQQIGPGRPISGDADDGTDADAQGQ